MNFLGGIPLGRWFGIRVVLSWLFLIYMAFTIQGSDQPAQKAVFMGALFATVLLHEFGHALSCKALGGQAEHIVLWPLGGLAFVNPPPVAWKHLVTTVCGPLVNVLLLPAFYFLAVSMVQRFPGLGLMDYFDVLASPQFMGETVGHFYLRYVAVWGFLINFYLLLFNLLPIFPMDGGRMVQEILWMIVGYPRSLLISGMTGTVGGLAFIGLGLGLAKISIPVPLIGHYTLGGDFRAGQTNMMLVWIGGFAAYYSFRMYRQAQGITGRQRG